MTLARRLSALTALCLALAAAVAVTGERRGVRARRPIAPGLALADVTKIEVARPGAPPVVVELGPDGAEVTAPVPGPADEAVVRDLVSAIATARADRVGGDWSRAGLDEPRLIVRLGRAAGPLELRLGAAQPASGQVWLGVDRTAMLVPTWVAGALDRDLLALRQRRPFTSARITGVELHGGDPAVDLVLAGDPLVRRDAGTGTRVAAGPRARLLAALAALELDVLVDGPRATPALTVRVLGGAAPTQLAAYGPCPGHADHVLVDGSAGVGCVPAAAVAGLHAAAREIAGPGGVSHAPLDDVAPAAITIARAGGGEPLVLRRSGGAWQLVRGSERLAADDDAVHALLAALARPAAVAPVPATPATGMWTIEHAGGALELWELRQAAGTVAIRRAGEAQALMLDDVAHAAVAGAVGGALRARTLLVVEPTSVARVVATGAAPAELERGATLDEWRVIAPAGRQATPAVAALVDALATVRAVGWLGAGWLGAGELGAVRRTIAITVDAAPSPGAEAVRHTIEIGAARRGGRCAARVDAGDPAELAADDCVRLLAPLAR